MDLRRIWTQWVDFWTSKETGSSIAGVRIGLGLTLLYTCAIPYFHETWIAIWVDQQHGGIRPYSQVPWFLELLGGATQEGVQRLLWLGMGSSFLLAVGIASRLNAFIGMLVINSISWHNPLATGGHDDLIANGLWLLVFVQSDQSFSLRSFIKTGHWSNDMLIDSTIRKLLIAQLLIMYASTGFQKVSIHWIPTGDLDAVWYILQQPTWAWRDHTFLAPWFVWTQLATLGTWCFEVCSPLLILFLYWENCTEPKRFAPQKLIRLMHVIRPRWIFAFVGIPLHLSIAASMDVGPFSWAALSYYWALYRPRQENDVLPSTP